MFPLHSHLPGHFQTLLSWIYLQTPCPTIQNASTTQYPGYTLFKAADLSTETVLQAWHGGVADTSPTECRVRDLADLEKKTRNKTFLLNGKLTPVVVKLRSCFQNDSVHLLNMTAVPSRSARRSKSCRLFRLRLTKDILSPYVHQV